MALNIPNTDLPGNSFLKGIDTGSTMFSRLMQPVLERERQKQQAEQFAQELALKKQAAARAGALDPMRKMILEQQLLKLKHSNDPMYEMNQYKALEDWVKGQSSSAGVQQEGQQGAPQMPIQEMGEGMGMFTPEGLQGAQQQVQNTAPANNARNGGIDLELLKAHPMLRGFAKKHLGFDPLATVPETPEQKHAGAINQAISIDEAKATRKKLDEIEKTAQALLPYLGKVNTIADILKRKPDLAGRTTQLADLLGMTKDEDVGTFLSAAQALQAHMAKEMSSRGGYGVSKLVEQAKPNLGKSTAYNAGVIKDLKQSMKESFEQMKSEYERLSNGKKFPYNFEQYFKEVIGSEMNNAQGGMVPMISPNGKRVMIPSDKVDAALAAGGKHA
jgi:hypothetical protein